MIIIRLFGAFLSLASSALFGAGAFMMASGTSYSTTSLESYPLGMVIGVIALAALVTCGPVWFLGRLLRRTRPRFEIVPQVSLYCITFFAMIGLSACYRKVSAIDAKVIAFLAIAVLIVYCIATILLFLRLRTPSLLDRRLGLLRWALLSIPVPIILDASFPPFRIAFPAIMFLSHGLLAMFRIAPKL